MAEGNLPGLDKHRDNFDFDVLLRSYTLESRPDVSVTIASLPLQKPPSTAVRRQEYLNSDDDIPPDFDKPWSKSDVVLRTPEGKELHANKAVLSVFSSYFDALFSGRFANKDVSTVNIKVNYNAMKEILRNIHHINHSYKSDEQKKYDFVTLTEMYAIGDYYNFPHIRKLCLEQMSERPSVRMAISAAFLGLQDTLMSILKRLPLDQIKWFLSLKDVPYHFTKKEFLTLYEYAAGRSLPKPATEDPVPNPLNLEEVTEELKNPRIDLTKPWELADVVIYTKNSMGRVLYANQTVINVASTKFKNLSFTPLQLEKEGRSISSTMVDAEYTTMKEILSVLHHCDTNYQDIPRLLHPALLHSMYRVAAVDQWNIQLIRKFCVAQLLKSMDVDHLEVFADLGVTLMNCTLPISKWRDWIYRKDGHFSYRKGGDVVVLTPSQDEPRFATPLVLWLIEQFSVNLIS